MPHQYLYLGYPKQVFLTPIYDLQYPANHPLCVFIYGLPTFTYILHTVNFLPYTHYYLWSLYTKLHIYLPYIKLYLH